MRPLFNAITSISAILLIITILIQNRGQSLGVTFGGDGSDSYRSKRGAELVVYNATIVLAVIFVLSIVLGLLLK